MTPTTEPPTEPAPAPAATELSGRALEMAVAESSGWHAVEMSPGYWSLHSPENTPRYVFTWVKGNADDAFRVSAPHYLTDPAAAMGLMDAAVERFGTFGLVKCGENAPRGTQPPYVWSAYIDRSNVDGYIFEKLYHSATDPDKQVAICRCFLAACEAEAAQKGGGSGEIRSRPRR